MIIFGNESILPYLKSDIDIVNVSSYNISYGKVLFLIPPTGINYENKDFDMQYSNFLLSDEIFYDLFRLIIEPGIIYNKTVLALVHRDDGGAFDMLTESLQKFIQQRYGYNTYIVNEPDDLYAMERDDIENITREVFHIDNMYVDMSRYNLKYHPNDDYND